MLGVLRKWWKAEPEVASLDAFREFLSMQAVFASQKSVMGYCEVKAGTNRDQLFAEAEFRQALDFCRWESFAAVLADVLVLSYRLLRAHADGRDAELLAALARLYPVILDSQPHPAHRAAHHTNGWDDLVAPFAARLEQLRLDGVAAPAEVARTGARRILQVLPIHENHRRTDREAIEGAVRFHLVAVWEAMTRQVDAPALASALLKED
ncbi:MAG TPA: hypothetical protein VD995_07870 [Azospirillum sp.]|nr:hypothetical protein [Azospirillum sp.]